MRMIRLSDEVKSLVKKVKELFGHRSYSESIGQAMRFFVSHGSMPDGSRIKDKLEEK